MKAQTNRLTFSQQFFIATMLFGLFFGAGNLIFPIFLGSQAGRNVWPAIIGLLITGVGILVRLYPTIRRQRHQT